MSNKWVTIGLQEETSGFSVGNHRFLARQPSVSSAEPNGFFGRKQDGFSVGRYNFLFIYSFVPLFFLTFASANAIGRGARVVEEARLESV